MESISKILFWVANSLLIPDIIILLFFFARSLFLIGEFYNQFMTKRSQDKKFKSAIHNFTAESKDDLIKLLPEKDNSLFVKYLRQLLQKPISEPYTDYIVSRLENEADKEIGTSRILSKIGPVLGLIGTLIAMSPALIGLSTGDISGMAYNMQVVFATTVVGLVISAIGLITLQVKQRWYTEDINRLDFISQTLLNK